MITKTINATGLAEIRKFLAENHNTNGIDLGIGRINAWAADAEFSIAEGNGALIEIPHWNTISGRPETFTVSDAGIDTIDDGEE